MRIGRGSRKEDRFSSCIPRIYRFFLLRFGGSSRDKTNDIFGENVPLCEDAGDECICFSFLSFFFSFFPFFDGKMKRSKFLLNESKNG